MKVLFVSMGAFENNTSATIQNKGIIRGLAAMGHSIDIMTLKPSQNSISFDKSMNDINQLVNESYYIEVDSKYAILMAKKTSVNQKVSIPTKNGFLKVILTKFRGAIKKFHSKTSIFDAQKVNVKGVLKNRINYDKYDIIISASDPKSSHLIVQKIFQKNRNCKAKWIQYWGDPMLKDITRESDWRDGVIRYNENKLISKAHRVIYASPVTLEVQKETYPKYASKMDYASQAYATINNNLYKGEINSIPSMGYFGSYDSKIRDIRPLYNSVKNENIILNICGPSDISLENTDNILINGFISYKEALKMEEECDILVCICNNKGTQIPGKIYYCSAYKKPIIVVLDGDYKKEIKQFLKSFNRFILCDNNENSIKEAIKEAKSYLNSKLYEPEISKQLTPKFMAEKILGEIKF